MLMFEETPEVAEADFRTVSTVRRFGMSVFGIGILFLIAIIALQAYSAGKIVKGVSVSHMDLSNLTLTQARQRLNQAEANQNLSFVVAGKRYEPSLELLGVHYDTEAVLERAYRIGRNGFAPHPHNINLSLAPEVDSQKFASYLAPIAKMGTQAVDARLEIQKGTILVIPDTAGWTVDKAFLEKTIIQNIGNFGAVEPVVTPQTQVAKIRATDLAAARSQAQALISTPISLIEGANVYAVTPADISEFIVFTSDPLTTQITARIAPEKVTAYIAALARRIDHPATTKKILVADGVTTIENEGKDGDAIDRDKLIEALSSLSAGTPIVFSITRHSLPFQTVTTNIVGIGSGHYIEINLNKQHLWVWDNHAVIYESALTSGAVGAGLGTVTGTFHIYYKATNTHLVGRDYDVPVKFWMPFYLGYGLHDAVWRNGNFGGQDYIYGGSHGCVNLPDATAAWLYNWADVGTPVYVHY